MGRKAQGNLSGRAGRQYLGWREWILRGAARFIARALYRFVALDAHHIPRHGPALLIGNHLSYIDWLFVATASPRPVRYVMHHKYMKIAWLGWVFDACRVIPIASARENPTRLAQAYDEICQALQDGDLVCIYPEGELTPNGQMGRFRPGILNILQRVPVPVVPMALENLWDSFLSLNKSPSGWPTRIANRQVTLRFGEVIPADEARRYRLENFEARVREIRSEAEPLD